MLKLPQEYRNKVKQGEQFVISRVGQGKAWAGSPNQVIELPGGDNVRLGDKLIYNGRGSLLKKLTLNDVVMEAPSQIITYKKQEVYRNNVLSRIA